MIQHYLKIAIRNLLKYRMQTLISIIGLTVGFVSFSLSGMWMNYEQRKAPEYLDWGYASGTTLFRVASG